MIPYRKHLDNMINNKMKYFCPTSGFIINAVSFKAGLNLIKKKLQVKLVN